MEKDKRLLSAAIFALAAAYFLTNLHKPVPAHDDAGGVYIHNSITGSVKWCAPAVVCRLNSRRYPLMDTF